MATKTSRRAKSADAATATDESGATGLGATLAPAIIADADATTDITNATMSVAAPRVTKAARLREMLDTPDGASLTALMAATAWQAHTVRAALSGLRKGGTDLAREKRDGDTIYRIVGAVAEGSTVEPETAESQPTAPAGAASATGVPA